MGSRRIYYLLTLVLLLISIILYYYQSIVWYNFLLLGSWLLFDNLAHWKKQKTTLDLITQKKYRLFLEVYSILLIFGILLEIVGSLWLGLWSYPKLWALEPSWLLISISLWGYLSYPFILISFIEMFRFFRTIGNKYLAIIISMATGILIWEIPNVYSQDWVYQINFFSYELFGVNLVVMVGWIILITIPLILDHFILKHKVSQVI